MAKKSSIEKNSRRMRLTKQYAARRARLLALANNMSLPPEERFTARIKLAALPRNSSATRVRNRCLLTGRSRGNYQLLKMSRMMLRELASKGQIPGMIKSSW